MSNMTQPYVSRRGPRRLRAGVDFGAGGAQGRAGDGMTLSARITTLMDYVSQAASIGTPNGYFVGDTKARSRTERDSKTRRLNMRTAESRLRAARTALDAGDPDMALLLTDEADGKMILIEGKKNKI